MQGSSGTWKLLFPSAEVAGGSNLVHKGESRQIPPGDRGQFVFDEQAGNEKLFIVLTRQPEPFEKVDSSENAAYVVNPSKSPDARLVVDIALKHK